MNSTEQYVCASCFTDRGLVGFVEQNSVSQSCSFCGSVGETAIAAPIADVSEHFLRCLFREYDLAVGQLVYDDGRYWGPHWDTFELATDVLQLEFPQGNECTLLEALFGEYFDQEWCPENAYGLDDLERPRYSWENFRKVVMHERRYFFMDNQGDPYEADVFSPAEILQTIFEYARNMGLFLEFPSGSRLVRVRKEGDGERYDSPGELGPPPYAAAEQANRMSPAGIPMFYGCDDDDTALLEVAEGPGSYALGEFETKRPAILLDLTNIPEVPSLFEPVHDFQEVYPRRELSFLHHISREISRCVKRDDRVHIEYVPTQVVTEFIRAKVMLGESRIDGIRYNSSVNKRHVSYVLFADQSNVDGCGYGSLAKTGGCAAETVLPTQETGVRDRVAPVQRSWLVRVKPLAWATFIPGDSLWI